MEQFLLRYEGPADSTDKTLRLIKGVFVADLEFPVTDVQKFILEAPITILSAVDKGDLARAFELLQHAGAIVLFLAQGVILRVLQTYRRMTGAQSLTT